MKKNNPKLELILLFSQNKRNIKINKQNKLFNNYNKNNNNPHTNK